MKRDAICNVINDRELQFSISCARLPYRSGINEVASVVVQLDGIAGFDGTDFGNWARTFETGLFMDVTVEPEANSIDL